MVATEGAAEPFLIDQWHAGTIADRMCDFLSKDDTFYEDDRMFSDVWNWGFFHGCEAALEPIIPLLELVEIYGKTTHYKQRHEARERVFDEMRKVKEALGIR